MLVANQVGPRSGEKLAMGSSFGAGPERCQRSVDPTLVHRDSASPRPGLSALQTKDSVFEEPEEVEVHLAGDSLQGLLCSIPKFGNGHRVGCQRVEDPRLQVRKREQQK